MVLLSITPGPAARKAFRTGIIAAALPVLVAVGFLTWRGYLEPILAGYTLLVLFPVYLVVAAAVLSVWLGYDKDATDLRPVYRDKKTK